MFKHTLQFLSEYEIEHCKQYVRESISAVRLRDDYLFSEPRIFILCFFTRKMISQHSIDQIKALYAPHSMECNIPYVRAGTYDIAYMVEPSEEEK